MEAAIKHDSRAPRAVDVSLRVYHEFERPRNGRRVRVAARVAPDGRCVVASDAVLAALAATVDVARFVPHWYDRRAECFVEVAGDTSLPRDDYDSERVYLDVKLVGGAARGGVRQDTLMCGDAGVHGLTPEWFAIGIVRGKTESNHGSLWRSALQFGAALTFTIGARYERKLEGNADVFRTHQHIPCIAYNDVAAFVAAAPLNAQWVAVEYGGTCLTQFVHPPRAVYILGSEDCGISPALVQRAHHHISIPVAPGRPSSLNVAAAGAIILYDRKLKEHAQSWGPTRS